MDFSGGSKTFTLQINLPFLKGIQILNKFGETEL
jgi:hypothetical protein